MDDAVAQLIAQSINQLLIYDGSNIRLDVESKYNHHKQVIRDLSNGTVDIRREDNNGNIRRGVYNFSLICSDEDREQILAYVDKSDLCDEAGWRYCIYTGKECCRCNRCQTPIIINNEPPKQSSNWFLKILLGLVILAIIFVALSMIPFFGHVQDPILMQEPVNNYYTSSSISSNY